MVNASVCVATDPRVQHVLACADQYLEQVERTVGQGLLDLTQVAQRELIFQLHHPEIAARAFNQNSKDSLCGCPTRYDLTLRLLCRDLELFFNALERAHVWRDPQIPEVRQQFLDALLGRMYSNQPDSELSYRLNQAETLAPAECRALIDPYVSRVRGLYFAVSVSRARCDTFDALAKVLLTATKAIPSVGVEQALCPTKETINALLEARARVPLLSATTMYSNMQKCVAK